MDTTPLDTGYFDRIAAQQFFEIKLAGAPSQSGFADWFGDRSINGVAQQAITFPDCRAS